MDQVIAFRRFTASDGSGIEALYSPLNEWLIWETMFVDEEAAMFAANGIPEHPAVEREWR